MKKILGTLITVQMVLMLFTATVFAATPTASVTGPSTVRASDTITVKINMNGTGLQAVQGEITYDSSQLTYNSNAGSLAGWAIDIDGATAGKVTFLGIDDKLAAPINSNKQLFALTFTVKSSVATGANIKITAGKLSASDGTNDFEPSNAVYSVNTAAPLSTNAFLSAMTVSNATISPAFSKETVNYSATVPFSVSKLEVSATAEDSKANVAISGQNLAVGVSTVSVVVTAENGSKKTYSIKVTRDQDPNYQAANNADLKSITPSIGILSPVFDPAKTLYNVYLPFEITSFNATGEAADAKATGVESEAIELGVGDNEFTITGIAEDGTRKEYKIIVTRMPAQGEEMPDPTPTTAPTEEPVSGEDDGFTLSGTLVDGNGDPLANKTVELHSEIKTTTTDANGFYKFENVTEGDHTLYVKDEDDTEIANISITFTKSNTTEYSEGVLKFEGDTKFDLAIEDTGVEVINAIKIAGPGTDPVAASTGLPWWGTVLIALAAAVVGFVLSRVMLGKDRTDIDNEPDRVVM